jgi:hypothetical protein
MTTTLSQPAVTQSVPFTEIRVDQPARCGEHDLHFKCSAGYEESVFSWEFEEVERIHAAFQAGGVPYTVTRYSRALCTDPDCNAYFCLRDEVF